MQLFPLHHPVFTLKELLVVLVLHAHAHRRLNAQRLGDLYTVQIDGSGRFSLSDSDAQVIKLK